MTSCESRPRTGAWYAGPRVRPQKRSVSSAQRRATARPGDRRGDFAGEVGGGGFLARGFLEEEEGGQGLAGDVQGLKDGHHFVGELADFSGLPLRQVGDRQIERGEGGVKGVALGEERLADVGQQPLCPGVITKAGGYPALHPIQAKAVLRATVRRGQLLELGQEVCRFLRTAGRGEVVQQVVVKTEEEAGLSLGIDEAVRLLQGLDGGR